MIPYFLQFWSPQTCPTAWGLKLSHWAPVSGLGSAPHGQRAASSLDSSIPWHQSTTWAPLFKNSGWARFPLHLTLQHWSFAWTYACRCFTPHFSGLIRHKSLPLSSECTAMPCDWLLALGIPASVNDNSDLDQKHSDSLSWISLSIWRIYLLRKCEQAGRLTYLQVMQSGMSNKAQGTQSKDSTDSPRGILIRTVSLYPVLLSNFW